MKIGTRVFIKCKMCLGDGKHPSPDDLNDYHECTTCKGLGKVRDDTDLPLIKINKDDIITNKINQRLICAFRDDNCHITCAAFRQMQNDKGDKDFAACARLNTPIGELECEEITNDVE